MNIKDFQGEVNYVYQGAFRHETSNRTGLNSVVYATNGLFNNAPTLVDIVFK